MVSIQARKWIVDDRSAIIWTGAIAYCSRSEQRLTSRSGWTLMELIVVVTLVAMIAGLATVNLKGPLKRTQFESTIEQIKNTDHILRRSCLKTNQSHRLVINPENNSITFERDGSEKTYRFPAEIELEGWLDSAGQMNEEPVEIVYDSCGATKTFGVCVALAGSNKKKWLIFLGRSGQCIEFETEHETENLFASIRSFGANTD